MADVQARRLPRGKRTKLGSAAVARSSCSVAAALQRVQLLPKPRVTRSSGSASGCTYMRCVTTTTRGAWHSCCKLKENNEHHPGARKNIRSTVHMIAIKRAASHAEAVPGAPHGCAAGGRTSQVRFRDEPSGAHTALPLHASALKSHTRRVRGASLVQCLRARLLLGGR